MFLRGIRCRGFSFSVIYCVPCSSNSAIEMVLIVISLFLSSLPQIFDIGKGEHCPITGIEFHKVPQSSRHIILVSTLNRLYKFHEVLRVEEKPPYLQHIFTSYLNVPEDVRDFHAIPNKLKYSKLRFNYDRSTKFPKCFGWLTDAGIYSGEVITRNSSLNSSSHSSSSFFRNRLINEPKHRSSSRPRK